MEDANENKPDGLNNFGFENYSDENKNPSESSYEKNDSEKTVQYDGFEEYKDDESKVDFVPVIPGLGAEEKTIEQKGEANLMPSIEDNNNDLDQVPIPKITPEERARRAARRERLRKEKERKKAERDKRTKSMISTVIVFCVLLFIMWLCYYGLTNLMPEKLMEQGKKYLEIGEYKQALKMFKQAANARPYDSEPVLYQVKTLTKMPQTYETQAELYEISQLDNCDKASEYADTVIYSMKKQINKQFGSNYADNILYDGSLFRLNNSQPITYAVINQNGSSKEYIDAVRKAFLSWSTASNGQIMFKELNDGNADIVISLLDSFLESDKNNPYTSGVVEPKINNDVLEQVSVYIKTQGPNGKFNINNFKSVAQHEIGHALGIWGHSSNPNDIMYYNGDNIKDVLPNKSLSSRDVNTLNLLYSMIPDVINKPLSKKDKEGLFYHSVVTSIPGEDFDAEIKRLLTVTKNNPRDISAWVDLGIKYGMEQRYKQSNVIFNRILPLVKGDVNYEFVIYYNLASNYYKLKKYDYAERCLYNAIIITQDLDTDMLSAFIDLKQNRKKLGKTKLIKLNEEHPEHIEIAVKLAEIYFFDKELEKSKDVIDRLTKINPKARKDKRVLKYKNYNIKVINELKNKEKDKNKQAK